MWSGITVLNYNNPEQKYSTSEREISKKTRHNKTLPRTDVKAQTWTTTV